MGGQGGVDWESPVKAYLPVSAKYDPRPIVQNTRHANYSLPNS
jgi:hypothetical protein